MQNTFTPVNNSININPESNLEITFDKNIQKGNGLILIKKLSDDSIIETIDIKNTTISNNKLIIDPVSNLPSNIELYINIPITAVLDMDNKNWSGISSSTIWGFKTSAVLSNEDIVLSNLKYYPNPVSLKLTISNNSPITKTSIYDINGKELFQRIHNSNKIELQVVNLKAGIYFVKVYSNNLTKVLKFIKIN